MRIPSILSRWINAALVFLSPCAGSGLHRLANWLKRTRIRVILPGRVPAQIILPGRLARRLRWRAEELGQPLEVVLSGMLSAAVNDSQTPDLVELVWQQLTEREQEIARLMAQGLSNQSIAARLMVSRNTIRTHVQRVLRKFGCRSRHELPGALKDK